MSTDNGNHDDMPDDAGDAITLTVKQLRDRLVDLDDDLPVFIRLVGEDSTANYRLDPDDVEAKPDAVYLMTGWEAFHS